MPAAKQFSDILILSKMKTVMAMNLYSAKFLLLQ